MKTPCTAPTLRALSFQLDEFRAAELQYRPTLSSETKLAECAAALNRIEPELRRQAGDPPDPKKLTRLIQATPEYRQARVVQEGIQLGQAEMGRLWREMQPSLDKLRSDKTSELFVALDSLSRQPAHVNAPRRIELVQEILLRSGDKRRGQRVQNRVGESDMAAVKVLIKQLAKEQLSHEGICIRLDQLDHPRPPKAAWTALSYLKAFRHKEHKSAVKTFLSRAINQ